MSAVQPLKSLSTQRVRKLMQWKLWQVSVAAPSSSKQACAPWWGGTNALYWCAAAGATASRDLQMTSEMAAHTASHPCPCRPIHFLGPQSAIFSTV